MNIIKCIIKTYLGSIAFSSLYLWLIHERFQLQESWFIIIVMLIGNIFLSAGYVIIILIPFAYIFKPMIATLNHQQAIHKYLFFFSLLPLFLLSVCIALGLKFVNDAIQFSLLCVNISSIVFIGFIYFLKHKTSNVS